MNNFKVTITSNTAEVWGGYFESEELANEWLAAQKLKEGRREIRVVVEPLLDAEGNEQYDVDENVITHEVTYPAEATYLIEDVSVAALKEERLKQLVIDVRKNKADLEFGMMIIALVGMKNEAKGLTHEQKNTMMFDSTIQAILGMLQAGRIGYTKTLVTAYTPDGTLLTQADKDDILQLIDDHLAKWS